MYLVSSKIADCSLIVKLGEEVLSHAHDLSFSQWPQLFLFTFPGLLSSLSLILILQIIFYITADSESPDLDE